VLGLAGYGLEVGCDASFVLLQARSPAEAIRLRAHRLLVVLRLLIDLYLRTILIAGIWLIK
jgi:cytosine/adenosine deaminase-related metal-dependent hydrolase